MWAICPEAALAGPLPVPGAGAIALLAATFATSQTSARELATVSEGTAKEGEEQLPSRLRIPSAPSTAASPATTTSLHAATERRGMMCSQQGPSPVESHQ